MAGISYIELNKDVSPIPLRRIFNSRWHKLLCQMIGFTAICVMVFTAMTMLSPAPSHNIRQLVGKFRFSSDAGKSQADAEWTPSRVWQVYNRPSDGGPKKDLFSDTIEWHAKNPDLVHTLMGREGLDEFVGREFADRPDIVGVFTQLATPILRADFARYLLVAAGGGIYADLDTRPLRDIREWIPPEHRGSVRALVGVEYDRRNDTLFGRMAHPLMFCQYVLGAAPGHSLMRRAVDRVALNLQRLAESRGTDVAGLGRPSSDDIMLNTGPNAWTTVVFEELASQAGRPVDFHELTGMTRPRLFGDVLVLPINYFGSGQTHSGSLGVQDAPEALVQHKFSATWWEQVDISTGDVPPVI